MNAAFEKRLGIVWAFLSAISAAQYFALTAGGGTAPTLSIAITVSVILVSLVKVRLILLEFMEVRHASPLLRRLTDLWLLVTAVCLLGTYYVGPLLWLR